MAPSIIIGYKKKKFSIKIRCFYDLKKNNNNWLYIGYILIGYIIIDYILLIGYILI
jgi:hypothetical protein